MKELQDLAVLIKERMTSSEGGNLIDFKLTPRALNKYNNKCNCSLLIDSLIKILEIVSFKPI